MTTNTTQTLPADLPVNTEKLQENIQILHGKKVLVLGDVMLDVYLQGRAERISQEAPVPIVHIDTQKARLGGAANVAHNIRALGGLPTLVGLCGAEHSTDNGHSLIQLLQENYIAAHVIPSRHRHSIIKTRIMAQNQQMLRFDQEDCLPPTQEEFTHLCHALDALIPTHDVLIISDYAKGLITPELSTHVHALAAQHRTEVLIDPKPQQTRCYSAMAALAPIGLMTPNKKEASQLVQKPLQHKEEILQAGQKIMHDYACTHLLITLGGEGMALFLDDGSVWNIASTTRAVFDVTGAGDSVIATLALARAAKLDMLSACLLSNYAAGCVLEHVGVATVTPNELHAALARNTAPTCLRWK